MEYEARLSLNDRTYQKEVYFPRPMPTENYSLGISFICSGKTSIKVGVKSVLKGNGGFKVVFTRPTPSDKWVMHYHAKHK